jgi:hypothetical protein
MVSSLVLVGTPFLLFTAPSSLPHTPNLYRTPSSALFIPLLLLLSAILFNLSLLLPQFPPAEIGSTQSPTTIGYHDLSPLLTTNPTAPFGEEDTTHTNIKRSTLVIEPSVRWHDRLVSPFEEVRSPPTLEGLDSTTSTINSEEESPSATLIPREGSCENDTRLTTNLIPPTGEDDTTTHNNINRSVTLMVTIPSDQVLNDNTYETHKSLRSSCITTITGVDVMKESVTSAEFYILLNRDQCPQKLRLMDILLTTKHILPNGGDGYTTHNNINSFRTYPYNNKSNRYSCSTPIKGIEERKESERAELDILIMNRDQCPQKLRLTDILLTTKHISPIGDDEYTTHNNINSISIYQVNRNDIRRI